VPRLEQDGRQQLVAGALATGLELLPSQQPASAGVGPTASHSPSGERTRSIAQSGAIWVAGVQRDPKDGVDERQQRGARPPRRVRGSRSGGPHRYPVRQQDPAQRLVASLAADHDRHLTPRNTVEEVSRPQPRGDMGRLLGRRSKEGRPRPAPPSHTGSGARCRPPPSAPIRVVIVRLTSTSAVGCRYAVWRTTVGGSAVGSGRPSVVQPVARMRGSAPRNVCTAASGSPTRTRSGPAASTDPAVSTRSSRPAAKVSSCASSTTMSPHLTGYPHQGVGVVLEQVGRCREDPGGVVGPRAGERRDLVVLRAAPARPRPTRAARAPRPAPPGGSASMPCSTARMSRSRSSARKPRLSRARRTCSGHGGRGESP
jgi:hypothetical protein